MPLAQQWGKLSLQWDRRGINLDYEKSLFFNLLKNYLEYQFYYHFLDNGGVGTNLYIP